MIQSHSFLALLSCNQSFLNFTDPLRNIECVMALYLIFNFFLSLPDFVISVVKIIDPAEQSHSSCYGIAV